MGVSGAGSCLDLTMLRLQQRFLRRNPHDARERTLLQQDRLPRLCLDTGRSTVNALRSAAQSSQSYALDASFLLRL